MMIRVNLTLYDDDIIYNSTHIMVLTCTTRDNILSDVVLLFLSSVLLIIDTMYRRDKYAHTCVYENIVDQNIMITRHINHTLTFASMCVLKRVY